MSCRQEISSAWREPLAATGLDCLSRLLESVHSSPSNAGHWENLTKPGLKGRQRVRWQFPDRQNGTTTLYIKRYEHTPFRNQLDRIRRQSAEHSRAWWEYHMAEQLSAAHIPTAAPVGYVEEMYGRIERRSAVLLAAVPGDAFDRTWTKLVSAEAPATRGALRHDVTIRLARFVAAFHSTGLFHRDLYLCHVFAEIDPGLALPPRFHLIDLARLHRPRVRRMRWLVKDLAQLDSSSRAIGASRTDRLRFLLAYLGLQRVSKRARGYIRRVLRKSERILSRMRRKALSA
jgi:heptose I phosphotransferase